MLLAFPELARKMGFKKKKNIEKKKIFGRKIFSPFFALPDLARKKRIIWCSKWEMRNVSSNIFKEKKRKNQMFDANFGQLAGKRAENTHFPF